MEDSIYNQLDDDGGRKLIFKMARDRNEEGVDVKGGKSGEGSGWEVGHVQG